MIIQNNVFVTKIKSVKKCQKSTLKKILSHWINFINQRPCRITFLRRRTCRILCEKVRLLHIKLIKTVFLPHFFPKMKTKVLTVFIELSYMQSLIEMFQTCKLSILSQLFYNHTFFQESIKCPGSFQLCLWSHLFLFQTEAQ